MKILIIFILTYAFLSFGYLIYRYLFSLVYSIKDLNVKISKDYTPKVSIVIPCYNENPIDLEKCITASCNNSYPNKEIIVIDDGSKNKESWETIERLQKKYNFKAIKFPKNKGKRQGMYTGFKNATGEIVITMDSDSIVVNGDSIRNLVQPFKDKKVGAVSGNIQVLNKNESLMTRIQWARYWLAFNIEKASQSPYSGVTCCSGPFSATSIKEGTAIGPGIIKSGPVTGSGDLGTLTASASNPITVTESGGQLAVSQGEAQLGTVPVGSLKAGTGGVIADASSLGAPVADSQANLGFYKLPAIGSGTTAFFTAHLIEGVVWGGILALGIKYIGPMLGLSDED